MAMIIPTIKVPLPIRKSLEKMMEKIAKEIIIAKV